MRSFLRFIPAGAGNRTMRKSMFPFRTVHPRWRGEQAVGYANLLRDGGSSPLARGTAVRWAIRRLAWRFIPAGAGNSLPAGSRVGQLTVHPRWRGEQGRFVALLGFASGSSPLARGTVAVQTGFVAHVRFIPAGAGNRMA